MRWPAPWSTWPPDDLYIWTTTRMHLVADDVDAAAVAGDDAGSDRMRNWNQRIAGIRTCAVDRPLPIRAVFRFATDPTLPEPTGSSALPARTIWRTSWRRDRAGSSAAIDAEKATGSRSPR